MPPFPRLTRISTKETQWNDSLSPTYSVAPVA